MTSYAMVLPADENRISAKTLQADNTERGQWGMVTISVECLECQSGKVEPYTPFNR